MDSSSFSSSLFPPTPTRSASFRHFRRFSCSRSVGKASDVLHGAQSLLLFSCVHHLFLYQLAACQNLIYIYTQVECCKPAVTNLYVSTQYTQTNVVKNRENRRVDESMCSTLVFISVIREKRTRQLLGNKRGGNRERRTARHELII